MVTSADNVEMRCTWQKHGEAEAGATGILRCKCRECARKRGGGVIVIHHFDLSNGEYITRTYRDTYEYLEQRRRERANLREA